MNAHIDVEVSPPLQDWCRRRKDRSSTGSRGSVGLPGRSRTNLTLIDRDREPHPSGMPSRTPRAPDAPLTPLAAGQALGDYRLIKKLGRGAQGDVWKAIGTGRFQGPVALKILKPTLARNPARMAQFRREAERGIRLMGPALLPVFEVGSDEGYHYMAMPLIEGIAMTEVLRDRKAFMRGQYLDGMHWIVTMKESDYIIAVTKTLAKAVRALAMVHDLHIVHRDIKPANIMIDRNRPMGVFLCDFGLGRDLDVATPEQMRDGAGTPLYMAPERLRRELANEILCDIYSLGVTLFEATTLERPFRIQDNTPWSAVPAFLADSVAMRPSDVHPDFPRPLESIITRAMARDPNDRYPSAHAMAHDLDRYLATTQSPARTASIGTHAAPSVRGPHQNFRRPARPVPRRVAAVDSNIGCLSFIPVFEPGSSSSNMSREPKSPERQTG